MKKKIPIVYVEFLDHSSSSDWKSKDELKKRETIMVYAVGWLIDQTKEEYRLALEITEDGDFGDNMNILKSTVKKFKKLNIRV